MLPYLRTSTGRIVARQTLRGADCFYCELHLAVPLACCLFCADKTADIKSENVFVARDLEGEVSRCLIGGAHGESRRAVSMALG